MSKITVENLVLKKNQNVTILKGLNTEFESGKLNAIMGPNGCGKTTFLNILFGNIEDDVETSGTVLLDGKERTKEEWFNEVSYVHQNAFLMDTQTVREALQFALDMRNATMNSEKKLEDFENLIEMLHLKDVIDTKISVLSGGEKKRTMIGIELITMKRILILDEPTSDLDSHLALKLVMLLKKIAQDLGVFVIFTIHKPSDHVFKQFDNLLFMKDGRALYSGEGTKMLEYFETKNIVKPKTWVATDFIFEAFYGKTHYREFDTNKSAAAQFLSEITEKSNSVVKSAITSNKGSKDLLNLNFSVEKAVILFKRYLRLFLRNQQQKWTAICVLVTPFLIIAYVQLIKHLNLEDVVHKPSPSFYDFISGRSAKQDELAFKGDKSQVKFSSPIDCSIYSTLTMGCFMFYPLSILSLETGFIWMKEQLKVEIQKRLYTTSTLCLATLMAQSAVNLLLGTAIALLLLATGNIKYLGGLTGMFFASFFATAAFAQILLELVLKGASLASLLISLLGFFVKVFTQYSFLLGLMYICLQIILPESLHIVFNIIFLIFTLLNPSTYLYFLAAGMFLKKFTLNMSELLDYFLDITILKKFVSARSSPSENGSLKTPMILKFFFHFVSRLETEDFYRNLESMKCKDNLFYFRFGKDAKSPYIEYNAFFSNFLTSTVYGLFGKKTFSPYFFVLGFALSGFITLVSIIYLFSSTFSSKTTLKL